MSTPPDASAPVSRQELVLVFAGLMLALTLAALDQNIVATALPRIVSDLGGLTHLSWVVTAFMVASTTTTPLYGKLSDIYGRKPLFMVAISIFLVGSVLCGLSQSMLQLILFRAVQGLGAGGLITLAQTTVGDLIAPRERGKYQGLFVAVFGTCSVAGPLLGGFITDALSWRWIFYVNLPVGAAALSMIAVGLKRKIDRTEHRIDYTGAGLLSAGTIFVLLCLSWGGSVYGWTSPVILGLGLAGAGSFGLMIALEGRASEPILPLRLFRDRGFVICVAVIGLNAMALFGSMVFLPLFFQLVRGASPSRAGLMMAPMMGGVIFSSILGGRLISRTGRYKFFPILGLGLATCAFWTIAVAALHGVGTALIETALVGLGCGFGFVMPTLTVALQNAVKRPDLGVATSAAAFLRSLGGALGVAVSGAVVASQLRQLLPASWTQTSGPSGGSRLETGVQQIAALPSAEHHVIVEAYRHAIATTFLTGGGIAALAFVVVLFLPERPLRSQAVSENDLSQDDAPHSLGE